MERKVGVESAGRVRRFGFAAGVLVLGLVVAVGFAQADTAGANGTARAADIEEIIRQHRELQSRLLPERSQEQILASASTSPLARALARQPVGRRFPSLLDENMVLAYYGNPFSKFMGALGEQPMEQTAVIVKKMAATWDAVNGEQGVIPGFHLIYATAWEDANVGILSDEVVKRWVDYAASQDMIVILDHQMGKHDVVESVGSMLKWLKYPNVHLAIDPEWKTLRPGKEVGSVRAEDINRSQEIIQAYLVKEGITTRKLFLVHQFYWKMISNREAVRSDFDRIDLIHNADGYGPPNVKLGSYEHVALATNMPLKGFKLFFPKTWKTIGWDSPLMTPEQVLQLNPRPVYINYQ